MPKISQKGLQMPESPIRKLVPFAELAESKGKEIYYLNIGQPDIPTPQKALDAVKENDLKILSYSPSSGFDSYKTKLAEYYKRNGIHITKDQLIVSTGGSEALMFAMGSITDPGDEVIIPEPFYANYNGFATAANVSVKAVQSKFENNFALPPIEEFEALITPKTKAIVMCNPGNPTGYLYTEDEVNKLAKLALKHDLFIIADEVYREFTYDGAKHKSIMAVEGLDQHAIMVDSVSKRYSMCGARIGCMVSRNAEVIATAMKFAQARLSPPTFAQIASEAALETTNAYFEEVNTEYVSRRDTLINALSKVKGVKVANPKGAFYCIAELPVKDTEAFAKWLLSDFELNGKTVMVAPASGFYSTPHTGLNQIRIAYVLEKELLIDAVKILEAGLNAYQGD